GDPDDAPGPRVDRALAVCTLAAMDAAAFDPEPEADRGVGLGERLDVAPQVAQMGERVPEHAVGGPRQSSQPGAQALAPREGLRRRRAPLAIGETLDLPHQPLVDLATLGEDALEGPLRLAHMVGGVHLVDGANGVGLGALLPDG